LDKAKQEVMINNHTYMDLMLKEINLDCMERVVLVLKVRHL